MYLCYINDNSGGFMATAMVMLQQAEAAAPLAVVTEASAMVVAVVVEAER